MHLKSNKKSIRAMQKSVSGMPKWMCRANLHFKSGVMTSRMREPSLREYTKKMEGCVKQAPCADLTKWSRRQIATTKYIHIYDKFNANLPLQETITINMATYKRIITKGETMTLNGIHPPPLLFYLHIYIDVIL